jgi:integrase
LSVGAQTILSELPRIAGSDFVFSTTGVSPISGYSNAKERLDRIVAEVAQEEAYSRTATLAVVGAWRVHDLRRTVASGMARSGTPPHVIEAILNHRNGIVSGVAAVYNRYDYYQEKRAALEVWAHFVAQSHTEALHDGLQ